MPGTDAEPQLTRAEQVYAIKTWRYLRLGMVALLVALVAAVLYEVVRRGDGCWQTSISAYYYTYAQAVFVGVLVAMGVCLVCLRGSTPWEDALLNVAGMLAPVVALVPTPDEGDCTSLPWLPLEPRPVVENNVTALLVAGAAGLLFVAWRLWRTRATVPRSAFTGYAIAAGVWAAGLVWFLVDREGFVHGAHYAAAIPMFLCIVAVAVINAVSFKRKQGDPNALNRYAYVVGAMGLGALVAGAVAGDYRVLALEAVVLLFFLIFWLIQTQELWGEGVRADPAVTDAAG